MSEPNRILVKMLERLRAGLLEGPGINCRPHQSRQRVDLKQFDKFDAGPSAKLLLDLLGAEKATSVAVRLAPNPNGEGDAPTDSLSSAPPRPAEAADAAEDEANATTERQSSTPKPGNGSHRQGTNPNDPFAQKHSLLHKLKVLADDARVYELDTGIDVLHVGFPLLNLPPGKGRGSSSTRRVLAPLALIPVRLNLKMRPRPMIEIACRADRLERVVPNPSLFAWMEQSGKPAPPALFDGDAPLEPWCEIRELSRWIAETFGVRLPDWFANEGLPSVDAFSLVAAPRADAELEPSIVASAVLGLFPVNNQGLIRDMEAMVKGDAVDGPVRSFIDMNVSLDAATHDYAPFERPSAEDGGAASDYQPSNERLVSSADPCQARAVRLARSTTGLVVHGPPGTGKSQTITNVVGDHLMRGQRVLVVCDKRTALDVVADRLAHLGLGSLAAVVHDPDRDQREFYRSVREQLESLADTRTDSQADRNLMRLDQELQEIRQELVAAHKLLHAAPSPGKLPFHELLGDSLAIDPAAAARSVYDALAGDSIYVSRAELESNGRDLRDLMNKADVIQYGMNAWTRCAGMTLDEFLARPGEEIRTTLQKCIAAGVVADGAVDPGMPAFRTDAPLGEQVAAREDLSRFIGPLLQQFDQQIINHWLAADDKARCDARRRLDQIGATEQVFRQGSLDPELWCLWGQCLPEPAELARQVGRLEQFLAIAGKWRRVFFRKRRARANELLLQYGLPEGHQPAQRLHGFLRGCQARRTLRALLAALVGTVWDPRDAELDDDRSLTAILDTHHHVLEALGRVAEDDLLEPIRATIVSALGERAQLQALHEGLRKSAVRAERIERLEAELKGAKLFRQPWLEQFHDKLCQGEYAADLLQLLLDGLPDCESVLRIDEAVDKLPANLRKATTELLRRSVSVSDSLAVLDKLSWEHAIRVELATCPKIARLDGERLSHNIQRYRDLRADKHQLVCAAILHRWLELQKQRLLVSTRSRLSSEGADVRRRLAMQGDRAMRLRKVIEVGNALPGGDPLFDLRPVWMASPETVAQIFPRLPLFDVIVFDEASQCRLEQALPVLTRGRRVVIAGDTKQLPPTRFFETALVSSEDDAAENEQEWFELQQGEVEDLLTAALNLQVEQCYLDVHYRSRNADLISFSNDRFYSARLQPIPGHPRNRTRFAPISLYHAKGVYEERTNRIEAEAVCRIVRDLLRRAEPPSIGIACFNMEQRDLIVDCLDDLAVQDADFASRLAEARSRRGVASPESLFVKNLENVQGDERDHMVISTTYGPDPSGRFYRRFGPLGRAGGGRRLNVLVTRARHEVHLVTSIPAAVYRGMPRMPLGQAPNGAWLLFSYLVYAEQLVDLYARANAALDERDEAGPDATLPASVDVQSSVTPSLFAKSVARNFAQTHRLPSQVHWGNEGFCVDVALGRPGSGEDVTIGLLCDFNRYHRADDRIEWEIFRTDVLEATGWQLQRIWSPQYFRDPAGVAQRVVKVVNECVASEDAKNALRVTE